MLKRLAISAAAAGILAVAVTTPASAASVSAPFDTPGPVSAPWVASGQAGQSPNLTPYVPEVVASEVGGDVPEYAFRLTDALAWQAGYLLYDQAIPTTNGVDVQFTQAQWGGNGADGIAFFIKRGDNTDNNPGWPGGSIGYTGMNGALLGVGFDSYGNFAISSGSGCNETTSQTPQALTVRGPGDQGIGYCLLADPVPNMDWSNGSNNSRATSARSIHIVIDPLSQTAPKIHIYVDGVLTLEVDVPAEFWTSETIKFGFTGGTGGDYDNHEIWGVNVTGNDPALPDTGGNPASVIATGAVALGLIGAGALIIRRRRA